MNNTTKSASPRANAIAFLVATAVFIKLAFEISWWTVAGGFVILLLCIVVPATLMNGKYPRLNKDLGKPTLTILLILIGIGGWTMYSQIDPPPFTSAQKVQTPVIPPTPPTQAEIDANQAKEAAELAKKKAEDEAYTKSPAGKLCAKHPDWSAQDCAWTVEGRYWIGMKVEMLVYRRGNPNNVNPSNYGRGTMYQYCWTDYVPSCFYDDNDDHIVDSFN